MNGRLTVDARQSSSVDGSIGRGMLLHVPLCRVWQQLPCQASLPWPRPKVLSLPRPPPPDGPSCRCADCRVKLALCGQITLNLQTSKKAAQQSLSVTLDSTVSQLEVAVAALAIDMEQSVLVHRRIPLLRRWLTLREYGIADGDLVRIRPSKVMHRLDYSFMKQCHSYC